MDESSTPQNPRAKRSNVLLAASIEQSGRTFSVKLRNLSSEGALIEGDDMPIEGSHVLFRRNELAISSRVAWVHGRHAGVAFSAPLDAKDVMRNIPKPKPRVKLDFRRPGLACRELSSDEKRLVEQWIASAPPHGSLGE
ncbi:MAG: PilZ domain-containing protein [Sphingomicrobium sp.]